MVAHGRRHHGAGIALGTGLGHADLIRIILVLGLLFLLSRPVRPGRALRTLIVIGLVATLTTIAVEGHGGTSALTAALDVVHLAAAGTWIGGLVALCVCVRPGRTQTGRAQTGRVQTSRTQTSRTQTGGTKTGIAMSALPAADGAIAVLERPTQAQASWAPVHRFSRLALASVLVVVTTGVIQAVRQVPDPAALTATRYGQLLIIKVALVALTVAVAAISRATLHNRTRRPRQHRTDEVRGRTLARSIGVETALLILVLAVTSALVATTPARAAYRPVQERTVTAGPVSVQLTAAPTGPLMVSVHLYAFGADGLPTDVSAIEAQAAPRTGTIGSVTIPLTHAGTGHFLANGVLLPRTGTWVVTLVVHTGEFEAYSATTSLSIG